MIKKLSCFLLAVLLSVTIIFAMPSITASANTGSSSNDGTVYDSEDNALYRHTETGVVFNAKGEIAYDDTSTPLYYNPATKKFTNDKNDVLTLYDRPSSRGGKYLKHYNYTVSSVSINDEYAEFISDKGNKLYVRGVWTEEGKNFWTTMFGGWTACWEWFTLTGSMISKSNVSSEFHKFFEVYKAGPNTPALNYARQNIIGGMKKLVDDYPKQTLFDLLEKIELVNDNATVLTPKDDRGKAINTVDGQLFDYFDYPLLGADSKPLFYDKLENGTEVYFGIDGRLLTIDNEGYLTDNGYRVHSVISNLLNDELLYFLFMRDGVTICPLYGIPQTDADGYYNGVMVFTYLNGELISNKDFIIPDVSTEDIYIRYPDMRPPADTGPSIWDIIFGGLGLGGLFSGLGNVLTVILIVLALIILAPLIPYIFTLLVSVIKGFIQLIKKIVNSIIKAVKKE